MAWFWASLCSAVIWGFSYAFMEKVIHHVSFWVYFLILYCLTLPAIFLYVYFSPISLKAELTKLSQLNLWPETLAAAVLFFIGNLGIFYAISRHNAAEVSAIEITYPIFVFLVTWLIFKTYTPHWGFFIALTLILAGVATLYLTTPR